ncbi:hypothetical protein COCNU_03G009300 [Cocos nucifera]|uniref:Uncharacterized protein n=1 Tax=Cocos nucifera TaxID=13894 RepID=A0A8K0MZC3_COCNU|nr:hypothetical protein COCNU_03G009300 [Cocos nucifera]
MKSQTEVFKMHDDMTSPAPDVQTHVGFDRTILAFIQTGHKPAPVTTRSPAHSMNIPMTMRCSSATYPFPRAKMVDTSFYPPSS